MDEKKELIKMDKSKSNARMQWLKRLISVIMLGIILYLFWPLTKELRLSGELFRAAHWEWLVIGVMIQIVSYVFLTWLNKLTLQPFEGDIGFVKLMFVLTTMAFVEVAIPSAGASGVAWRVYMLKKHGGYTMEVSMFTLLLETIFISIAMASISLLGIIYLLNAGSLGWLDVIFLVLGGLVILVLAWLGWRVLKDDRRSQELVHWSGNAWNKMAGKWKPVDPVELEQRLAKFRLEFGYLRGVPIWKFFIAAYGRALLDVATLGACFMLFGKMISPGSLLTGYGLMLLMSGLAALPGGVGMADVSAPVIFARLGAPGAVTLVASLTYRLVAFWMLRFIGFINWHILE
jgi:uncharacterized protein (TIRG00374 family)